MRTNFALQLSATRNVCNSRQVQLIAQATGQNDLRLRPQARLWLRLPGEEPPWWTLGLETSHACAAIGGARAKNETQARTIIRRVQISRGKARMTQATACSHHRHIGSTMAEVCTSLIYLLTTSSSLNLRWTKERCHVSCSKPQKHRRSKSSQPQQHFPNC